MSTHSFGSFGSDGKLDSSVSNRDDSRSNRQDRKKRGKKKKAASSNDSEDGLYGGSGHSKDNDSYGNNGTSHSRGSVNSLDSFGSNRKAKDNRRGTKTRSGRNRTKSPKGSGSSSRSKNRMGNASYSSNGSMSLSEINPYDDEDFLEAPNSDNEVKSVVSKNFDDIYQRGRRLGLGAFAVVFIGTHRPSGKEYAVKQIDRSTMFWGDRDALQDEIVNLKMARSGPNIVQLYEVYEEKAFCYLIMEVMEGGELLECIIEKKTTFTEKEARSATRCVLRALAYLHSSEHRVAHRDIKPENLLLSDPYQKDLNTVKLADFSFARQVKKRNDCRTLCGTPGYLSPEMLERFPAYDVKCDVWSVGCLLFLLLGGFLPFDDEDDEIVFDLTRRGQFEFKPEFWNGVSQSAKDLVTKMLTVNPKKRISASKALQSHWIEHGDEEFEEKQEREKKSGNLMEGKRKLQNAINTVRFEIWRSFMCSNC